MKKLLVMALLIFAAENVYSQSIDISYGQVLDYSKMFTVDAKVGLPILIHNSVLFTPYGGWKTWAMMDAGSGKPFRDTYQIGLRIEFKNFYVDYNHYCSHDVVGYRNSKGDFDSSRWMDGNQWDQALTTVSFGYKKTFDTWEIF